MANTPSKPTVSIVEWINNVTKLNHDNMTNGINSNLANLKTAIDGTIDALGDKVDEDDFKYVLWNNFYNSTYGYSKGDVVYYDGYLYEAKADIAAPAGDFDYTKWQAVSIETLLYREANALSVTYAYLKELRDGGNLIPGTFYRITDYDTFTTESNTTSAWHHFDVIVEALTPNSLFEEAHACLREGDTYFANSNLGAWKLRYCLDNDTTRFGWADATNGKGVIYRMIDEFGNDCPYDFKNILFTKSGKYTNAYTFSYTENSTIKDASILGLSKSCYNNVMKEYYLSNKLRLNWNVFYSTSKAFLCYSNTFGSGCSRNTFGNYCNSNTFGDSFSTNTFGNYCNSNTFGDSCGSNTFGDYCGSNTFGNTCTHNTFGNRCSSNTFDSGCSYNAFGDYCYSNTFGSDCSYITFGDSSSTITYCRYNIIDSGCQSLYVNGNGTASTSNQLQNIHIHSGIQNKTITVDRGLAYSTDVYVNGSKEVILDD